MAGELGKRAWLKSLSFMGYSGLAKACLWVPMSGSPSDLHVLTLPRIHSFFCLLRRKSLKGRTLPSCLGTVAGPAVPFPFPFCSTNSIHSSVYSLYFAVLVLPRLTFQQHGKCLTNLFPLANKKTVIVQNKRNMTGRYLGKLPSF